jgi:hypothetical protein
LCNQSAPCASCDQTISFPFEGTEHKKYEHLLWRIPTISQFSSHKFQRIIENKVLLIAIA